VSYISLITSDDDGKFLVVTNVHVRNAHLRVRNDSWVSGHE